MTYKQRSTRLSVSLSFTPHIHSVCRPLASATKTRLRLLRRRVCSFPLLPPKSRPPSSLLKSCKNLLHSFSNSVSASSLFPQKPVWCLNHTTLAYLQRFFAFLVHLNKIQTPQWQPQPFLVLTTSSCTVLWLRMLQLGWPSRSLCLCSSLLYGYCGWLLPVLQVLVEAL